MDVVNNLAALRDKGGYSFLPQLTMVEVCGEDAGSFLQARTTNDVLALLEGKGQSNSLLDRTAHILSLFSVHRLDNRYFICLERTNLSVFLEELEKYHFNEKVQFKSLSQEGSFFQLAGPLSPIVMSGLSRPVAKHLQFENDIANLEIAGTALLTIRQSRTGEDGFLFWIPKTGNKLASREEAPDTVSHIIEAGLDKGFVELSFEALDTARIEAGIPTFGLDISAEDLLVDTGLEEYTVSYTKGCYVGQEVIARIKTYSAPRKGLVGLVFDLEPSAQFPLETACSIEGELIGRLKSNVFSPTLDKFIAMAYVTRERRVPNTRLALDVQGVSFEVTVQLLPFYKQTGRTQRAVKLYEEALDVFAREDEQGAIRLMREALALDPRLTDCYESLGVILSRHDQLDQAIELMRHLVELEPQSVMAHTNLSVFYMQKGDKEAAEEEKAISMSIRMEELVRQAGAKQEKDEDERQKRQEANERIAMFKEVLSIDADDMLANNGIGSIYCELGLYEEALPHLLKAIEQKPSHTVAYQALSGAYTGLGRIPEAIAVLNTGIEVAAKRGDMTPLKEMQLKLTELVAHTT